MRNRLIAFALWWAVCILFLCILALAAFTVLLVIGAFARQFWILLVMVPLICLPTGIILWFGMNQLLDYIKRGNWALRGKKH